jgi:hypothetical protein
MYGIRGICLIFGFHQKCHGMPSTSWWNIEAPRQFWKISVVIRQKNAEYEVLRQFQRIWMYMEVYWSIVTVL